MASTRFTLPGSRKCISRRRPFTKDGTGKTASFVSRTRCGQGPICCCHHVVFAILPTQATGVAFENEDDFVAMLETPSEDGTFPCVGVSDHYDYWDY